MKKRTAASPSENRSVALARLEGAMERTAARLDAIRARHAARLRALAGDRQQLQGKLEERARPLGASAWEWVQRVHGDGSAARVRHLLQRLGTFADSVQVLGPLREDGSDGRGGTGDYWVSLRLEAPGLDVANRTGPAWGTVVCVRAAPDLQKAPPRVLERLAQAIASGAAWERVTAELATKVRAQGRQQEGGALSSAQALAAEVRGLRRALKRPPAV
jgi:hypothetical protein